MRKMENNQKNLILDYDQAEKKLRRIASKGKINQEDDLGISTYGLPIHHYTIGSGQKEIVITGATHGCEIISADFVMNLMEKISDDSHESNINFNEYKLHFIPILNPEGYLIATSAVRKLIPREMSSKDAEKICKDYYLKYRQDDIDATEKRKAGIEQDRNPEHLRHFQEMFKDVDYTCIPEKYLQIRESVREILEKYPDIPKGTLQIWSANANGIDPQANSKYNSTLIRALNGKLGKDEAVYVNNLRYGNINQTHPGPINSGFDPEKGYEMQPEVKAISDLLSHLSEKGTLHSYFNYHSVGGLLYQRPAEAPKDMGIEPNEMWTRTLDNFALSKFYARKTYKNENDKANTRYRILTGKNSISTSNDEYRIKYPRDILVELSGMGANPIGPYGDIKGNYKNLMESNLEAFEFAVNYADVSEKISRASYQMLRERLKGEVPEDIVQQIYGILGTATNMVMSWTERFGRKTRSEVLADMQYNLLHSNEER